MKTKFAAAAVAALTLVSALALTSGEAEAKKFPKWGYFAAGALITGAAVAAATSPYYYEETGYRECFMKPRYNKFGEVVGYRRVCEFD